MEILRLFLSATTSKGFWFRETFKFGFGDT
ncbi:hypothetical protein E1A91_A10G093900v1 [Gossypium mustelinum]|uniref:Uncharacterized protein n=1 Tax=Gossypium mustelinum TaxID=34275 RepID=A0A5D2XJF9_GOSMU|nr:hypothetical protein E1A91_A10G093900v1 [Gossypium mustelinum]